MLRRITIITIVEINGDVAIQPKQNNLKRLFSSASDHLVDESTEGNDVNKLVANYLDAMFINQFSVNKEIIRKDENTLSTESHQEIYFSNYTISTKKAVIENAEKLSEPKSDQRLVRLIFGILTKFAELLDISLQEAVKEITKKLVNITLWLLILIILAYAFNK